MFLSLWLSVVVVIIFERFIRYLISSHKPKSLDKYLPPTHHTNWTLIMVEVKTSSISKKIDAEIGFKISGLSDSTHEVEEEFIISIEDDGPWDFDYIGILIFGRKYITCTVSHVQSLNGKVSMIISNAADDSDLVNEFKELVAT